MEKKDEIKKKAEELTNEIKRSEEKLKNLRKTCRHSDGYSIKNVNFDSGSSPTLRRVCNLCDEVIGYPSKEDLSDNGYT